ncbi:hypothetical protein [Streptomyces sp. NBC_01285]|nr:hypothetical protein [Streptomyces sp. NBC_01285]MCX4770934.1 hypothetical protein [Streptomyces sp. NBC_01285]
MRDAYSLLGARHDLTGNQDPLLQPSELFVHDEFGGVHVFRSENQGCAFWGVRPRDLDRDDPPVFVRSRDGWAPFLERVSLASAPSPASGYMDTRSRRKQTTCLSRHSVICLDGRKGLCSERNRGVGMADPYVILDELAQELRPMPRGIERRRERFRSDGCGHEWHCLSIDTPEASA